MLTKAQIAKLPVEQQEILAQIELSKTRRRQKLLELARGLDWRSRYWPLYFFAVIMILLAFDCFVSSRLQKTGVLDYSSLGVAVISLLIFHITRLNRRLNALLELLDFDRNNQDDSNNSKDEKVG